MGDVISSHLDEAKREIITARSREVMGEFGRLYEQQYAVALFNKVRFDIEGGGGPQSQLLQRKIPLENKSIFSGSLFQYLEENKKWRNRFIFVPDSYNINYYDSKASHDRRLHPKGTINCAGYKVLTSLEQYLDLISSSLPDVKAKVGSSPFLKCPTQFPLILWHPYAHHYYFCVVTEKEQQKWHAVLQDCVRHANDGLSEENKVQTPAFTDAVRLYRQAQGHYGTWEMMCGVPSQILSNLVMEGLLPELRELISPRLKGKLHERQRNWMLISDAVYSLVQGQCQAQYEAVLQKCEAACSSLEASIRTDMDQIITSKEHVTNKIREVVLPKSEKLLKVSIEPYISSILEALMEPTSRGFSEVRDVFFRELVDMSKNTLNEGTKETVAQHMEKISMLAYHPVKMQSCYEKVEPLSLEGLQQRFDVSSPSVFVQRAQILMREQMDQAVYTFEQILHQSLESQGTEELCKTIQRCQDRVIKKFDYDSSTVRKRFFREALLQIFIPYMLKQLNPSCASELPRFQELIFEDFSRFILVENIFEEVVLHSVMKDIMMAVKEAAVQRRHNLYRDSMVLGNSDPSLHLLGENPSIDWAGEYGGAQEEADGAREDTEGGGDGEDGESQKRRRMKQVVSMIQVEGSPVLPNESCVEVPGVNDIPEEDGDGDGDGNGDENSDGKASTDQKGSASPEASENPPDLSNGSVLKGDEAKPEEKGKEEVPLKVESAAESASAVEEKGEGGQSQPMVEERPSSNQEVSEETLPPPPAPKEITSGATETAPERLPQATSDLPLPPHDDSGFQSPTSEGAEEEDVAPSTAALQPSEEHPEVRETSVAVEKEEEDVAPTTAAPQPSEEHPEVKETSVAVEEEKEDVAPTTAAPQPSEEHPEVRETSVAVEEEEEDVARSAVAPQPSEEHPEVRETIVAVVKEEEDVAPTTAALQPSEHPEVRETSVAVEEEEEDVAPTTAALQPSEHPEVRETSVAVEEEKEDVVPTTAAPQPSEEHPEVRETSVTVEEEKGDVAPSAAPPQPTEEHPEVRETSVAVEKEEEDVAPSTATSQPSEHPEVRKTTVAVEKEKGDVAPSTAAPQPSEEQPEVRETTFAVEKEKGDVAPSAAAPQPSEHPEVRGEMSVAVEEEKEDVAPSTAAPSTAAPQSTEEHPEVRETSVAAAPETETKAGDQSQ